MGRKMDKLSPSLYLFLIFSFPSVFVPFTLKRKSHLARIQKMQLFIPSMACLSAALGSNSQSDRLITVADTHVYCRNHTVGVTVITV